MTQFEKYDEVLKLLQKRGSAIRHQTLEKDLMKWFANPTFDIAKLIADRHITKNTIEYSLTAEGEQFILNGGYSGGIYLQQNKTIQEDIEKKLMRTVQETTIEVNRSIVETNSSILETNKSIIETNNSVSVTNKSIINTNDSIVTTNNSVQSMNEKTEKNYNFQKIGTMISIFVALIAVAISVFSYFNDENKNDELKLLQQQLNLQELKQKRIDSLENRLFEKVFQDSLLKKHL